MSKKPTPDEILKQWDELGVNMPSYLHHLPIALREALAQRDDLQGGLSNSEHWHGLVCKERDELIDETEQLQTQLAEAQAKLDHFERWRSEFPEGIDLRTLEVVCEERDEAQAKLASVEKERDKAWAGISAVYGWRGGLPKDLYEQTEPMVVRLQEAMDSALTALDHAKEK